jgi:HEAT repeat protein
MKLSTLCALLLLGSAATADDELLKALKHKDPAVRQAGCESLQGRGPLTPAVVPAVAAQIHDKVETTRGACIAAMAHAGAAGKSSLPALKKALKDESVYVRLVAVGAVAAIGLAVEDPDVLEAVVPLVSDPHGQVRRFALVAIEELGALARPALPKVTAALQDPEQDVREAAARAMKAIGEVSVTGAGSGSASALATALKDPQWSVRQNAAETLGSLGVAAKDQRPALLAALKDPEVYVRQAVLAALPLVDPEHPDLVKDLASALSAPEHDVRKIAVVELEKLGPRAAPAVPALIPLLSGEEIYLRVFTADTLAAIGPGAKAALPRLEKMRTEKVEANGEMEAAQLPGAIEKAIAAIKGR